MSDLRGRVCVVTGASSGIGRQLALDLARDGARVALIARPSEDLERAEADARRYGEVVAAPADICDQAAVDSAFATLHSALGPVDAVIACAGIEPIVSVADMEVADIERVLQTNVMGMVRCVKQALPDMMSRHTGCIVTFSSSAARFPLPRGSAYCASKAAITAFSESLHVEMRPHGVQVLIVYPGYVHDTRMARHHGEVRGLPPRIVHQSLDDVSRAVRAAMFTDRLQVFLPRYLAWSGVARDLAPAATLYRTARMQV